MNGGTMGDILADETPKIVNIKFETDEEKELHARFKSKCALNGETMQERAVKLIQSYVEE